jgi:two-component system nitrogen regulation response regulator NtrX
VPALRERQQDIPLLAEHFMALLAAEYGRGRSGLRPEAAARLQQYGWPGNVRELRNVIERVIIMVAATRSPRRTSASSAATASRSARGAGPAGGAAL